MEQPLVSIVVPIYKVEKYLDYCIDSIVNQTYENIEIILVDDGSPDGCPLKCELWSKRDKRVKVVHKENGGLSNARNEGIKIATGKWLLFIDADDVVSDSFVESLVKYATDDRKLIVSKIIRFNNKISINAREELRVECCGKNLISQRGGMYCWGCLYSRAIINQVELLFDSSLKNLEDVVWNGIYMCYIQEILYVNIPYYYRITPNSITSKCSDSKWQVLSWFSARRSLMDWFANKKLTDMQKKDVRKMYRHCQNNIYAECFAANIGYSKLKEIERTNGEFCESFIVAPERLLKRYLPRLYYSIYIILFKIRAVVLR